MVQYTDGTNCDAEAAFVYTEASNSLLLNTGTVGTGAVGTLSMGAGTVPSTKVDTAVQMTAETRSWSDTAIDSTGLTLTYETVNGSLDPAAGYHHLGQQVLFGGLTEDTNMSLGVVVNTRDVGGPWLSLKKTGGLTHGMTSLADTDTAVLIDDVTQGGLQINTYTASAISTWLNAYSTTETAQAQNASAAPIILQSMTKSGTTVANVGAAKELFKLRRGPFNATLASDGTVLSVTSNGDLQVRGMLNLNSHGDNGIGSSYGGSGTGRGAYINDMSAGGMFLHAEPNIGGDTGSGSAEPIGFWTDDIDNLTNPDRVVLMAVANERASMSGLTGNVILQPSAAFEAAGTFDLSRTGIIIRGPEGSRNWIGDFRFGGDEAPSGAGQSFAFKGESAADGTDLGGGTASLKSGNARGTGSGEVQFWSTPAGASGTGENASKKRWAVLSTGSLAGYGDTSGFVGILPPAAVTSYTLTMPSVGPGAAECLGDSDGDDVLEWVACAGGGGSGDITDVWGCATGNCNALTAASGDTLNAGSADSTAPMKTGTAPPGTCTVGDFFFDTDATAGLNVFGCTATNTWTLQGDGAGSGTPGGANTQVQYNNSGAFAGSADFTWNNATATLTLNNGALNTTEVRTTGIHDSSEVLALAFQNSAGTAVNNFRLKNASTGNSPRLEVEGSDANVTMVLASKGTGVIEIANNGDQQSIIRLNEDLDNGSNYVSLEVPASLAGNRTFRLPATNGNSGEFLQSDGNGVTSWAAAGGGGTPAGADREIQFNNAGAFGASSTFKFMSDGDLLLTGTFTGTASVPVSGAGTRVFFDTQKAAFRAGNVSGTNWDNGSIGDYSAAFGQSRAAGENSFAAGLGNATHRSSIATGESTASGIWASAFGNGTASANYATAVGRSTASGEFSLSSGDGPIASGYAALATGFNTTASGQGSATHGLGTTASGSHSFAVGRDNIASGYRSAAFGRKVTAGNGTANSAFGDGTVAFGLIADAVFINNNSEARGNESFVLFMGDQDGIVQTGNDTFALYGGKMLVDSAVPATIMGAPTYNLSFSGDTTDQTIGLERELTAATVGRNLTVTAGGAVSGGTDLAGGVLILGGGTSTGTGGSSVEVHVASPGGTGTTDRTIAKKWSTTSVGSLVEMPSSQTIAGGDTITADACGGIKRITSASGVTTNTTNTFTAPAAANAGCILHLVNVGSNSITLDNNANFKSAAGADVTLTADDSVVVGSTGASGFWYQLSPVSVN